ncbi:hydrogenase expression/formation protein HypE, partial [candidate division KSB1 bacterium]
MTKHKRILLAHGSGGKLTHQLIDRLFVPTFHNQILERLDDGAIVLQDSDNEGDKTSGMAFTTDSYVVDPIFFPGGDIGRLAVCGTVNDLA